ncbi:SusC/RagA family TonB-linked outer membrane protein [Prolixibacteraceae bacterium JC049]|nr:SusC/RagA family TonB-linked outer membrane protein [Prolixibacteraceae bacterium JC049]
MVSIIQLYATNTYSQKATVSLKMKNATIENVFEELEKQTDVHFFYNTKVVDVNRKVDVAMSSKSLDDVLAHLFKDTNVRYMVMDKQVLLSKSKLANAVQQEKKTVSGKVTDKNGESLPGVSVIVKGTTIGITTDIDGNYKLTLPAKAKTLLFSFVGMKSAEAEIAGQSSINIVLEEDAIGLEEVVAVGYGVQKKTTVTGSISTVKGEKLARVPVNNISQAMAGRLSGISMRPNGEKPGEDDPEIHIRGVVTTGNSSPLVVVDGVKRNNIRQVDPSTIESITVLKDAAAVAPYGIGGANGVILITTKNGKKGRPVVRLSTSYGFQNPTNIPDMVNARQYLEMQNEGYFNINPNGKTPPVNPELIKNYDKLHAEDPWKYPNSDFTDVFNSNIPVQSHNLELSGGNDNLSYHAGLGYYDQKGIFDKVNYKRYNYNISLAMQATKTTKVGMKLHGALEHTNDLDPGAGNIFRSLYKFSPAQSLVYPGGDKWGESSSSSPVAALKSDGYRRREKSTLLGSFYLEQELPFIKGLSFKGVFSYDPTTEWEKEWHIPFTYYNINLDKKPYTYTTALTTQEGSSKLYRYLNQKNRRWFNYTYQAFLNYSRSFGDHSVTGLLVAEAREKKYDRFSAYRKNFQLETDELNMGSSDKDDFDNSGKSETGSEIGYVYRLTYNYKGKYSFETSGRYDGHYYFAPGKRWGYFPSVSAAWRLSEEDFMSSFDYLDNFKLRASWGKSGNLAGSPFQYLSGYNLNSYAYAFGGKIVQGAWVDLEANPNITWEISTKYDIGFDMNLWNGLLNVEFDFFHEDRTGMLLQPDVTLPLEYGLRLSQENKGEMKNNGFELVIGGTKKFNKDLEVNLSGNVSYAKNKMIEVFQTEAEANNPNRNRVGKPFRTQFGYKSLGLFSTDDDKNKDGIINAEDGYNVEQFGELHPGDIRYADISGPEGKPDGKIDSHDLTRIGYPSQYPLLTYGLTADIRWKNFDISAFFQGSALSTINIRQFQTVPFDVNGSSFGNEFYKNRWTPDNQKKAKYPRTTPSPTGNNKKNSDFWMRDTGFLRLKTLIVGYTLPKTITSKLGLNNVRCYFSGQNLLTYSKIKHIDPEAGYNGLETAYPVMKQVSFGIDVTF